MKNANAASAQTGAVARPGPVGACLACITSSGLRPGMSGFRDRVGVSALRWLLEFSPSISQGAAGVVAYCGGRPRKAPFSFLSDEPLLGDPWQWLRRSMRDGTDCFLSSWSWHDPARRCNRTEQDHHGSLLASPRRPRALVRFVRPSSTPHQPAVVVRFLGPPRLPHAPIPCRLIVRSSASSPRRAR